MLIFLFLVCDLGFVRYLGFLVIVFLVNIFVVCCDESVVYLWNFVFVGVVVVLGFFGIVFGRLLLIGDCKVEVLLVWCFYGFGECVESRGEGKGVMLFIVVMIGFVMVEFVVEVELKVLDRLLVLKLGVFVIECREEVEGMCFKESFGEGFGFFVGVVKLWWEFECGGELG